LQNEDLQLNNIKKFLDNISIDSGYSIHNISVNEDSILLGKLYNNSNLIVIYMKIPQKIYNRIAIYKNSLSKYNREDFLKPYFQMGIGIVLLTIGILVIIVAISLGFFLSRNITRPVLELVDAAGSVASGNFNIHLERDSSDELTLLFNSFNQMVNQLNESKKMTFQTQKLEAWREVAKKLLHEIKNPLTPIKLSAERIRKKFSEGNDDIENVIMTGTETIIEEVSVLTMMLGEFSKFARLPEIKRDMQRLNPIIENCINSFAGHEKITFEHKLDNSIPDLFIDRILMRQAFTNIIQNAVDAVGGAGHITIKAELIIEDNKKKARISIKDNGIGIKEEYLGRVFDPTFTTKESGSGIGLAIVNKIILEHNGKIICNSEYRKGTEFIIDLPVQ
jgi:nitrogen fixation/metabolism regulation signal transduction histidine kinase